MSYQVGELMNIKDSDPELPDLSEALRLATDQSLQSDRVHAVWSGPDHGSELLYLAYQGELFKQA